MWLEFSFQTGGDIRHVYSSDEAQRLIAAGDLTPTTRLTVYSRSGPQLMLAGSLDQLDFAPQQRDETSAAAGVGSPGQRASAGPAPISDRAGNDEPDDAFAAGTTPQPTTPMHAQAPAAGPTPTGETSPTPFDPILSAAPAVYGASPEGASQWPGTLAWMVGILAAFLIFMAFLRDGADGEQRWLLRDSAVYASPDAGSPLPQTLAAGTMLQVEGVEGNPEWVRILSGDQSGTYLRTVDLTDVDPSGSPTAVATAPPTADKIAEAAAADAASTAADAAADAAAALEADSDRAAQPGRVALPAPRNPRLDLPARCRNFVAWVDQQICAAADIGAASRRMDALYLDAVRLLGTAAAGPSPGVTRSRLASCNPDPACLASGLAARNRNLEILIDNAKLIDVTQPVQQVADLSQPVRPRGRESSWITTDDYPPSALRAEEEGTTAVLLSVGTDGRVSRCDVTASSGSSALDQTTCRVLSRRARFDPARDRNGLPIVSSFPTRVRWQVPR